MLDLSALQEDVSRLPSADVISQIGHLAIRQLDLQEEVKELEDLLNSKKESLRLLQEVTFPELLLSANCAMFALPNGSVIKVQKFYSGSISEENSLKCFEWLHEHNHDSLIKNEVKLSFGKGEDENAKHLVETLVNAGYNPVNKKTVHPQTLKAFIKEQVEAGADFPAELFNTHVGNRTIIK